MKRLAVVSVLLFFVGNATNAQAPSWQWAKNSGRLVTVFGGDYGSGVCIDASGNIYVTGVFIDSTITFGNIILTNANYTNTNSGIVYDIFIVKYDPYGNVIWAINSSGPRGGEAIGITADNYGNVYIAGVSGDTITFGNTTLINADTSLPTNIFVAKFDSLGSVLWVSNVKGKIIDVLGISVDANANVYITGIYNDPSITFGNITLTNANERNIYIVKYDSSGNIVWAKGDGANGLIYEELSYPNNVAIGISADATGDVFITGKFASDSITFGNITLTNANANSNIFENNFDVFIVKYDSSGNVVWAKTAVGSGLAGEGGTAICTDSNGNVYITGIFSGTTVTFDNITLTKSGSPNISYSDVFIVKYDPLGQAVWAKSVGGVNDEVAMSINADFTGNVYETGYSWSPAIFLGNDTLTTLGGINTNYIFVVKYDSSGNVRWARTAGGPFVWSVPYDGAPDLLGNVYVTGSIENTDSINYSAAFGTDTLICPEISQPIFVARLGNYALNGINNTPGSSNSITVFPNPTTSTIFFKNIEPGSRIEVYDVLGQIVNSSTTGKSPSGDLGVGDNYSINLAGNAKGIYFYRVVNNAGAIGQGKLVLE